MKLEEGVERRTGNVGVFIGSVQSIDPAIENQTGRVEVELYTDHAERPNRRGRRALRLSPVEGSSGSASEPFGPTL